MERVSAWCIATAPGDRHTSVLVARERELYRLNAHECQRLYPDMLEQGSGSAGPGIINEVAVSLCGRHLALLVDYMRLWLGSSDCRVRYCEMHITESLTSPGAVRQLVWCGSDAVILSNGISLTVYGRREGDAVTYAYDGSVRLVPEIDGVRIISGAQHEFMQRVPPAVQKIFRINSTDPGSFLLEASRQYQKRSHRADEYVCLVRSDLRNAVKQCVEAAGHEFDADTQKMLIRAAQFGRCFLAAEEIVSDQNSAVDDYVDMCRRLRVLNALRDFRIGLPLTHDQAKDLGNEALLERLVSRKHFRLAIEVARHLRLPERDGASRILARWAKYKVSQQQQHGAAEEDVLAKEIADKVGGGGVSFNEIAVAAADGGRNRLAIRLLDHEPRASLQVPLLLKLGEDKQALAKAIESGDTDLVYTVILSMRENMPLADFRLTIRNYAAAQALYKKYCREHNPQGLREIHAQEDDWCAQADAHVREAIEGGEGTSDALAREASLQAAYEAYKRGKAEFHATLCDENAKLVRTQRTLEQSSPELRGKLTGTSVHHTCTQLLYAGDIRAADRIRADFRIPERRYWWLRARSLAQRRDWTELEKLSRSKKSPIGYGPFVDVCLEEGNREEATKYLSRIAEELKVKYYVKIGLLEEGARIAYEQRSPDGLLHVQRRAVSVNNTQLVQQINQYISQLNRRSPHK